MFDWEAELEPKIEIHWRWLTYSERGESFKIYIDPPTRFGKPFTFYLPGKERWREVFPEWAADRREEIVARIKEGVRAFPRGVDRGLTRQRFVGHPAEAS